MASRSAREVAYETIRSRIITMDLKPGDELNDRELAQELGISRTPRREALIMLNIAHMVVIKPQSGTHVSSTSCSSTSYGYSSECQAWAMPSM